MKFLEYFETFNGVYNTKGNLRSVIPQHLSFFLFKFNHATRRNYF